MNAHTNDGARLKSPRLTDRLAPPIRQREANDCGVVARMIRGNLTICGFARCASCANRGGAK